MLMQHPLRHKRDSVEIMQNLTRLNLQVLLVSVWIKIMFTYVPVIVLVLTLREALWCDG